MKTCFYELFYTIYLHKFPNLAFQQYNNIWFLFLIATQYWTEKLFQRHCLYTNFWGVQYLHTCLKGLGLTATHLQIVRHCN